jgi:protein phosphatase
MILSGPTGGESAALPPIHERVLEAFSEILELPINHVQGIGKKVAIPKFTASQLLELCSAALDCLRDQPTVIQIARPAFVVGDIHGNLFDLIRVLSRTALPSRSSVVFLGDYVDRGLYSIQVIVLLFALMIRHPSCVFLLRGNHEFVDINSRYGFQAELTAVYEEEGDHLFRAFNDCFNWLPIAAIIGDNILCVHGGISPLLTSLRDIFLIDRPTSEFAGSLLEDLMWSDPTEETDAFIPNPRGYGREFGANAVRSTVRMLGIRNIIRAHQCVASGVEPFADGIVYTVFSCSNYHRATTNKCGLLWIGLSGPFQAFAMAPVKQRVREKALFRECPDGPERPILSLRRAAAIVVPARRPTPGMILRSMSTQPLSARVPGDQSRQMFCFLEPPKMIGLPRKTLRIEDVPEKTVKLSPLIEA